MNTLFPKNRVLVVDPFTDIGGPHQVLARLVDRLNHRGWSFLAVVPSQGATYRHFQSLGIEVCVVAGVHALRRGFSISDLFRLGFETTQAIISLTNIILERRISIVHSTTVTCWAGGIAARLTRVKSVYHVHDLTLGSSIWFSFVLASIIGITADQIICVSKAAYYALPWRGLLARKSTVIHNGVNPDDFYPRMQTGIEVREELGLDQHISLIGIFGGIDRRKGHDIFIKAAKAISEEIPNSYFIVVGEESPAALQSGFDRELRSLLVELGMETRVIFLGAREDISRLLQAVDLVIQPSRIETGPLVPLEAMSTGVAVVSTSVGGISEEIKDNVTGILVPPENELAVAQAAVYLLQNESMRKCLGTAGRRRVIEQFHIDQQASETLEIYNALLNKEGK